MIRAPRRLVSWFLQGQWRPDFLAAIVADAPDPDQLKPGVILCEFRGGYPKWAYFLCPRCAEPIQIAIAGSENWTLTIDRWWRPTLSPSIWQRSTCGAHFFVTRGQIVWCRDRLRV